MRLAILVFSMSFAALAQDNADIVSKVEAVKYGPLSRLAGIEGDVRLHRGPDGVHVISGHPLLVRTVTKSLEDIGALSDLEGDAMYHFVLVYPTMRIASRTVQRGDAFDRLILRALRIKTEKVVRESECVDTEFGSTVRVLWAD